MSELQGSIAHLSRTVTVKVSPGSHLGMWTVMFESEALPGTLAAFTGTLALARLDIVSAMVRVTQGRVSDVFEVAPPDGATFGQSDGETLAVYASEALNGTRDISAELRTLRRLHGPKSGMAPRVKASTDSSLTTGINVVAADRIGLLHDIAATLTAHGLRTRSLTALTFNATAHDTFCVVDAEGKPPKEPLILSRLQRALEIACA